ncbi:heavy metal translocating P-type ATPase [Staphylococcus simulans]|uniref:heavy metal translocating P-type ATPase n=1 Tax=Staphylococcus simulans TaxID=1286 RepID=UPI0018F86519|nr:heavy metal translocating P-type ATPase [Staphylococcus simulans]
MAQHSTHHEHTMPHDEHQHHEHHHHDSGGMHHMHHHGDFKKKFFVSLIMAIPIILLSPMMGIKLPFQFTFPFSEWLVLILATALFIYGGQPFLSGAKDELKQKKPGMMTLIALGISVAYFYSLYAFAMNHIVHAEAHVMDFFWELATLIVIMLLGHWVEMKAVGNAGNALEKMAALLPSTAIVIDAQGERKEVPVQDLKTGDVIEVQAGSNIPADGIIKKGKTSVDESLVTGEAKQVEKGPDDQVIGGAMNGSGTIEAEVTAVGESSYINQVMTLISDAQKDQSKAELLSDKVAGYLFYFAVIVGFIAFVVWLMLTHSVDFALERLVTVLIIACPHALGLAIPLVVARSTSLGASHGVMIKHREAVEKVKNLDVVMMDKTGTLTEGNFAVNHYQSLSEDYSDEQVLAYFAAIEQSSNHPLAEGILNKAADLDLDIPEAENVHNLPGVGLEGEMNHHHLKVVSVSYLQSHQLDYDQETFDRLAREGQSVSYLIIDDKVTGIVAQGDQIKTSSKDMVKALHDAGIKVVMLTGDNEQAAHTVAQQIGIDEVYAQLMPEDKENIIQRYQEDNQMVMMVGDGINDAPSLVRADIGVAIGAGTDVAIDSADIILVKSNPMDMLYFIQLSKATMRKMVQNLWWGAGYNIIAVPLAAGVLAFIGIMLSPAVGAVLMSLSTVIVAVNAMMLKVKKE